jgi:hypothetical protein
MANGLPEHPPAPPTLEERGKVILGTTLFIFHLPFLAFELLGRQWHDMAVTTAFCFMVFSAAIRSKAVSLVVIRALLAMPAVVLVALVWIGLSEDVPGAWKPDPVVLFGMGVPALAAYGVLIWVFFFSPPVNAYLRQLETHDVRVLLTRSAERYRAQRAQAERVAE